MEVPSATSNVVSSPTDDKFKDYFQSIYNSLGACVPNIDTLQSDVYMPVLDDPIMPQEVQDQVNKLKSNKAYDPDGMPPSVFK